MQMDDLKLVGRTHFRKSNTEDKGWQWFWATMTADEVDTVGVGGEGYDNLQDAINGLLSQQGIPDWQQGESLPATYRLEKIDEHHHVIFKFAKTQK